MLENKSTFYRLVTYVIMLLLSAIIVMLSPVQALGITGIRDIDGISNDYHVSDVPESNRSLLVDTWSKPGETQYCLRGKQQESFVEFTFNVSVSGLYDMTLTSRSTENNAKRNIATIDGTTENVKLWVDGADWQDQSYTKWLDAGTHTYRVTPEWGWIYIDKLTVKHVGEPLSASDTLNEASSSNIGSSTVYKHADSDEMLINPGKGLTLLGDGSCNDPEYFSMLNVFYTRFQWSAIEPADGVYDWSEVDAYIERAASWGKKAAFGVMSFNKTSTTTYVTPQWVFDEAGAEGKMMHWNGDPNEPLRMLPNWSDPIYQQKAAEFAHALGERYDGDPRIAWIDVRSYGSWGEQHCYQIDENFGGYPWIDSKTLEEKYFQPYLDSFKKTLLVNACNNDRYSDAYDWAMERGMALRRDGMMGLSVGDEFRAHDAAARFPVIYEYCFTYQDSLAYKGWTRDDFIKQLEFEVRNGGASYLQFNYDQFKDIPDTYRYIGNLLGYWWRMPESKITSLVSRGNDVQASYTIRNDGVAKAYDTNARVIARVLDENGTVVDTIDTDAVPSEWLSGYLDDDKTTWHAPNTFTENFSIPTNELSNGRYFVQIGIFGSENNSGTPDYAIGSSSRTHDNWQAIGSFAVKNENFSCDDVLSAGEKGKVVVLGNDGKAMDVKSASRNNGADVRLYDDNETAAQRWLSIFHPVNGEQGYYELINVASGKALDIDCGVLQQGQNVQQWERNDSDAQKWIIKRDGDSYTISPSDTNLFLAQENGTLRLSSTRAAHNIRSCDVLGASTMLLEIASASNNAYCVDVAGAGRLNGSNIQLYRRNMSEAQKFYAEYDNESGYYYLKSSVSGKYMDVACGSGINGANVQQWTRNWSNAQKWSIIHNNDGSYTIRSAISGKSLDIACGRIKSSTNIQCWDVNGSNAQRWTIR